MDAVVCVTMVISPEKNWYHRRTGTIKGELLPSQLDKRAAQMAVEIVGESGKVTALTVGDESYGVCLRESMALGCSEGVRVWDEDLLGGDSASCAMVLARAIERIPWDLVFCGSRTAGFGMGQIGPRLGSLLQVPHFMGVTSVTVEGETLIVDRLRGSIQERVELSPPAVIIVSEEAGEPRRPTALEIMKAHGKPLKVWKLEDIGLEPNQVGSKGSPSRVQEIYPMEE